MTFFIGTTGRHEMPSKPLGIVSGRVAEVSAVPSPDIIGVAIGVAETGHELIIRISPVNIPKIMILYILSKIYLTE